MRAEKKQVLITVKAYPNPSKKYGETVCCAGIDLKNFQMVRLYPIPYRDLEYDRRFKKYSIIEVDCFPSSSDNRPESYKVRAGSIKLLEHINTERTTWKKRKSIVFKLPVKSMCQVLEDAEDHNLSLGFIKPDKITFDWSKQSVSDKEQREACYAQLGFFNKDKDAIEKIPFRFYYQFYCPRVSDCPGHKLSIIDWEIGQAYRNWRSNYPDEEILLNKIKDQWLNITDITMKDAYFFVGNMNRLRKTFMVLGVFYPPK